MSRVSAELERNSDLLVLRQSYSWTVKRFWQSMPWCRTTSARRGFPPGFRRTLSGPIDPRRSAFEPGLGVSEGNDARFYPFAEIRSGEDIADKWLGRDLVLGWHRGRVLQAQWKGRDNAPMQLLTRWYGFSFTYPACSIFESGVDRSST